MKPGPSPKPTVLKVIQGNPGRKPLNKAEPKPNSVALECPSELSDDAKAEWNRLYPYLFRTGLLTEADLTAFSAYCQTYGRWIVAERALATEGELLTTDKGNIVQNPRLWVANKALDQMYKFMSEFGLTPASRSRVKASPPSEDEMEAYQKRGKELRQG